MELWDVYDVKRNKLGEFHSRSVPLPDEKYHLVVHAIIQNNKGEVLLSKRHPKKHIGNLWECTGGSVLAGETSLQGVLREVQEEIGLTLDPLDGTLIHQETRGNSHYDLWWFPSNTSLNELTFQPDEVTDAKWVDKETYIMMEKNGEIVPFIYHYFKMAFEKEK